MRRLHGISWVIAISLVVPVAILAASGSRAVGDSAGTPSAVSTAETVCDAIPHPCTITEHRNDLIGPNEVLGPYVQLFEVLLPPDSSGISSQHDGYSVLTVHAGIGCFRLMEPEPGPGIEVEVRGVTIPELTTPLPTPIAETGAPDDLEPQLCTGYKECASGCTLTSAGDGPVVLYPGYTVTQAGGSIKRAYFNVGDDDLVISFLNVQPGSLEAPCGGGCLKP